jgi:pimeloyl-ACP methyl ester carboxylesterase
MPELTAGGHKFFIQRMGEGLPTAVFIHGLVMDNLSSWWFTVANAAARHCDVLCYDLRGHGRSEVTKTGYSVADSVADLTAILDELGIDHPVQLIGNSYGGVVGLAFASAHPERTAGLVLVEAHASIEGENDREQDQLAHGLDLAGALLDEDIVNHWLDQVGGRKLNRMAARAKELIWNTSLVDDLRTSPPFTVAELKSIEVPVLLVFGENSDIIARARSLAELLPQAQLRVLDEIDHTALMSAAGEVREAIIEWLVSHKDSGEAAAAR